MLFKASNWRLSIFTALMVSFWTATAFGESSGLHYAGMEFYGSSQISRAELEKQLGLKPGASPSAINQAVERLSQRLDKQRLNFKVQTVSVAPDKIYILVDVTDSMLDSSAPTRFLKSPHHVVVSSEKPFMLLDQLQTRLEKLNNEGRGWTQSVKDGVMHYSDEPCEQYVEQLSTLVPPMAKEILEVVDSDPDPRRRYKAIQLLNWAQYVPYVSMRLIPALDDADSDVRVEVDRYLFPRFSTLPDDFPFGSLIEALSRQLNRPSHQDRSKSLALLLAIASYRPELINSIKIFDQERINTLSQSSVIPSIKDTSDKLLQLFAHPPAIKTEPPAPAADKEVGF